MAKPMFSCIRLMPGPDVAVMALRPVQDAPIAAQMALISSSVWRKTPPVSGILWARRFAISLAGVMGYPEKNPHPAAMAPSAQAQFPIAKWVPAMPFFSLSIFLYLFRRRTQRGLLHHDGKVGTTDHAVAAGGTLLLVFDPGGHITQRIRFFGFGEYVFGAYENTYAAVFDSFAGLVQQGYSTHNRSLKFSGSGKEPGFHQH
jgi:hypothetical protein